MRIIYTLSISVFLLALSTAYAKVKPTESIAHFKPGFYRLSKVSSVETAAACGEGDFRLSDRGTHILLGPKHGFPLKNDIVKTVATDDPNEKGCVYENSHTYAPGESSTILSSKEVLKCEGIVRHTFVETAIIEMDRIHLEFKQSAGQAASAADESAEYNCEWILSTRSSASLQKVKNNPKKEEPKKK